MIKVQLTYYITLYTRFYVDWTDFFQNWPVSQSWTSLNFYIDSWETHRVCDNRYIDQVCRGARDQKFSKVVLIIDWFSLIML